MDIIFVYYLKFRTLLQIFPSVLFLYYYLLSIVMLVQNGEQSKKQDG